MSKFSHERDLQGNLQVKPTAYSEDAYLIYSFCLNIMNIIVNKL